MPAPHPVSPVVVPAALVRAGARAADALRTVQFETGVSRYAEGSCLVRFGHTVVRCTASVESGVPPFLRNTGKGWVTAEYGMLPRATHTRNPREAAKGKQSGRTQEIQRLIGRSLRAAVDLARLGERQITVDCDVLEADGGTRTAAITGGWVALALACQRLLDSGELGRNPLKYIISAVSCGIVAGVPCLDLDYREDSTADADANFVLAYPLEATAPGMLVEVQGTAEAAPFAVEQFHALLALAASGTATLSAQQRAAV